MDMKIVYPGSIPEDKDLLLAQTYAKQGLGRALQQVYGNVPAAFGFSISGSSSSLSLSVSPGILLAPGPLLTSALGGVGGGVSSNNTSVQNQYLAEQAQNISIPQSGATYVLYAVCSEVDTDSTVLPFVSLSNPTVTQAGYQNSGSALPTRRTTQATVYLAPSLPAAANNTAVVALYTVSVPVNATTASNIVATPAASLFWPTIPQLSAAIDALTQQLSAQNSGRFLRSSVLGGDAGGSSGKFQWGSGTNQLRVRAVGGGGAGGYAQAGTVQGALSAGGGGASGAYIEFVVPVSALPTDGVIWATGAGGTPTKDAVSGAGSATTFNNGNIVLNGGGGGYQGASSTVPSVSAASYGGLIQYVGSTSAYSILANTQGMCGSSGFVFSGSNWPAFGANSFFCAGGTNSNASSGEAGRAPGSGGGGAGSGYGHSDYLGGSGAPGIIMIEELS